MLHWAEDNEECWDCIRYNTIDVSVLTVRIRLEAIGQDRPLGTLFLPFRLDSEEIISHDSLVEDQVALHRCDIRAISCSFPW